MGLLIRNRDSFYSSGGFQGQGGTVSKGKNILAMSSYKKDSKQ